ncbi:MAG: hypothetical protein JNM63_01740, partial [Spirochaetia bacterium]|nr:hypothetical protein [Spirochaetia bacterium]
LTAWTKTTKGFRSAGIFIDFFGKGWKGLHVSGKIPHPSEGAGWKSGTIEFTIPPETDFMRLMIASEGPGKMNVDAVTLVEITAEGKVAGPVPFAHSAQAATLRKWVELYQGEGRPYLLLGRMLHPPKLDVETIRFGDRDFPAILHNLFRSPDGSEALVLASAADELVRATLYWKNQSQLIELKAGEIRLIR